MLMPLTKMMSAWGYTGVEYFRFEAGDWGFSEAAVTMNSLSFLLTLLFSGTSNLHLLELICEGKEKKKIHLITNRMLYNPSLLWECLDFISTLYI